MKRSSGLLLVVSIVALFGVERVVADVYCGTEDPNTWSPVQDNSTTSFTLRQVLTVFRHGDRMVTTGSTECWKGDTTKYFCNLTSAAAQSVSPFEHSEFLGNFFREKFSLSRNLYNGTCGKGQLTATGNDQHIALGRAYAQVYADFLSKNVPSLGSVYVRSSQVDRTLASAQAFSNGLFPLKEGDQYNVYNIHTRDEDNQVMSPNRPLCPVLNKYILQLATRPASILYIKNTVLPLLSKLSDEVGYKLHITDLPRVFDCVNVHTCHKYQMPFTPETVTELTEVAFHVFSAFYEFPGVTQAGMGFLLEEILHHTSTMVDGGDSTQPFVIFSGHDTTVMPMLASLGVLNVEENHHWAAYASHITMEVYELEDKSSGTSSWGVRVLYQGRPQVLPGCSGDVCTWDEFRSIVQGVIGSNFPSVCHPEEDDVGDGSAYQMSSIIRSHLRVARNPDVLLDHVLHRLDAGSGTEVEELLNDLLLLSLSQL